MKLQCDLFDFAYVPGWYWQLDCLAEMALPEPWRFREPVYSTKNLDTPILERYIHSIFKKQAIDFNSEGDPAEAARHFHVENELCCFHTGLYTGRYKAVYACFDRNKKHASMRGWYFRGFADELSPWLKYVSPLPERPSYHMAQYGASYNPEWPIRVNIDHILGDGENVSRLPAAIREAHNLPLLLETAVELARRRAVVEPGIVVPQGYQGRVQYLLPVCLTDILGVWEEEFQKFADFPYCLLVLSGNGSRKRDTLRHMAGASLQVAVVNYESAWRMEKDLGAWRPDLIVADEGHKIKTHNISASRAMHRLRAKAGYRLLLTGTVITNKAVDVFSQYKFVNPAIFGQSFYAFRGRYFDMVGYGNHTPVLKKSMEAELMERMHSIAFRATKAECLDLPEMTDILRQVELEPAAQQIYRGLVKESYAELSGGEVTATNILTRLLRLSQLTGGFIGNDETSAVEQVSCAKLSALEDILDGIMAEGKKLVIIARFVPEIKAICRLLENRKLRYCCIGGLMLTLRALLFGVRREGF